MQARRASRCRRSRTPAGRWGWGAGRMREGGGPRRTVPRGLSRRRRGSRANGRRGQSKSKGELRRSRRRGGWRRDGSGGTCVWRRREGHIVQAAGYAISKGIRALKDYAEGISLANNREWLLVHGHSCDDSIIHLEIIRPCKGLANKEYHVTSFHRKP
eukprot:766216-Hanusia_phi.AAC.2